MSETSLVARDDVALEAYGDIAKVREMTRRLMAMLPSAKELGPAGAGALAQASIAMGLNPFTGEVWAIPQGRSTYAIMVGIKGLRSKAHEQAKSDRGMYTVNFRLPREEEIEGWDRPAGSIVRACDLTVSGQRAEAFREFTGKVPVYTGIGIYMRGESTKMQPLQVARKRAEADAIKQAFDVPLSFVYGGDEEPTWANDLERYHEVGDRVVNGDANQAIDEVYGEYIDTEPTGDPFLNGTDIDHTADLAEAKRELEGVEPEPPDAPHWLDQGSNRAGFWAWLKDKGISTEEMYQALDVKHLHDYAGTMGDAKTCIMAWQKEQAEKEGESE